MNDELIYRGIQVRVRAMEEEAIGCDEVFTEGEVLGVSSAIFYCPSHSPHSPRQGSPLGLQGQAGYYLYVFNVNPFFLTSNSGEKIFFLMYWLDSYLYFNNWVIIFIITFFH